MRYSEVLFIFIKKQVRWESEFLCSPSLERCPGAVSALAFRRVLGPEWSPRVRLGTRAAPGKPGGWGEFRRFLQGKGPPAVLGGQGVKGDGTRAPNLCASASMSPLFAAAAEDPTLSPGLE